MQANRRDSGPGLTAVGVLLLVCGAALLAAEWLHFEWPASGWPLFVIVPGVVLLLLGLMSGREPGLGLTVAGSIVTTIGAILYVQQSTGLWASWAYAWALIPAAAGLGLFVGGALHGNPDARRSGSTLFLVGGSIFAVGLVYFEGVVGLNGDPVEVLSGAVAPAILVIIGAVILGRELWFGGRRRDRGVAT